MQQELRPRQSHIFWYIRDRIQNHQISPTVREIGKHFGIKSPNGVMCHLRALVKKGYIRVMNHWLRESFYMATFLIVWSAFWFLILVPVGFALTHFLGELL